MIHSLSIEITSQCNIMCRHCAPSRSPKTFGIIDRNLLSQAIKTAAELAIPRVTATGGESFLCPEILTDFTSLASSLGIRWRIVSNGFWGDRKIFKDDVLKTLAQNLPGELSISVDRFHQEYIPLDTIHRSVNCSQNLGIPVELNVVIDRHEDTLRLLREVTKWKVPIALASVVSLGRGSDLSNQDLFEQIKIGGCDTVENPYLRLDGTVTLCCGVTRDLLNSSSALVLGNAKKESLLEILSRHDCKYSSCIKQLGPYRICQILQREYPKLVTNLDLKNKNYCELCTALSKNSIVVDLLNQDNFSIKNIIPQNSSIISPKIKSGLQLKADAEILPFYQTNNGEFSGHVNLPTVALIAFREGGYQEYCLIDKETTDFISRLSEFGWYRISEELEFSSLPSLKAVKLRLALAQLMNAGALIPITKEEEAYFPCTN